MTDNHEPLTPFSMADLLARISHEWESRHRIFDLPTARFFNVSKGPDISIDFLGRPAATPVGPAAGPHSQMAQNIVLSWLGGSRLIELKTVQIMDELEIGRPCIDMETIGYNIEWSQELKIPQSLEEYVKAWMIIEMMRRWDEVTPLIGTDTGPLVFDLSVGYDLAGISTDRVAWFIDSMMDAREEIERLRPQIGGEFARFRDMDFPARIADTVTLSTFHGCPPDEIESITKHLITRHGLDVIVKLNPTLLGFERVREIVTETLGYDATVLRREDFDNDLQFPRGVGTHPRAQQLRRRSRAPVRDQTHQHAGGREHQGVHARQHHVPVGTATPRGLHHPPGRAAQSVAGNAAGGRAGRSGAGVLLGGHHEGEPARGGRPGPGAPNGLLGPAQAGRVRSPRPDAEGPLEGHGHRRRAIAAGMARLTRPSRPRSKAPWPPTSPRLHNPATNRRYTLAGNSKLPRSVDHELQMWGCVACNFCVTVCPNDAFFRIPTPDELDATGLQQYLVLTELCNECGNCMVFCPEIGDPAVVKPRLFIDPDRFEAETEQAFLIHQDPDGYWVQPNAAGRRPVDRGPAPPAQR